MFEIDDSIKNEVEKIVEALVKYDNSKNLSWTKVYKDVLKKLKLEEKEKDNLLLSSVVRELTNRGYDIEGEVFKLERFK